MEGKIHRKQIQRWRKKAVDGEGRGRRKKQWEASERSAFVCFRAAWHSHLLSSLHEASDLSLNLLCRGSNRLSINHAHPWFDSPTETIIMTRQDAALTDSSGEAAGSLSQKWLPPPPPFHDPISLRGSGLFAGTLRSVTFAKGVRLCRPFLLRPLVLRYLPPEFGCPGFAYAPLWAPPPSLNLPTPLSHFNLLHCHRNCKSFYDRRSFIVANFASGIQSGTIILVRACGRMWPRWVCDCVFLFWYLMSLLCCQVQMRYCTGTNWWKHWARPRHHIWM